MANPKLTRRQRRYLDGLIELYSTRQEPVHHADLAARLGVRPVTAYEMLRVLEDAALAVSEYAVSNGPGRATVAFRPTGQARSWVQGDSENLPEQDWERSRKQLLAAIEAGRTNGYRDILATVLERLEEPRLPLLYAADMLTAVILVLHQAAGRAANVLLDQLRRLSLTDERGLNILNGLVLGLSLVERVNAVVRARLLDKTEAYSQALSSLRRDQSLALLDFTCDLIRMLQSGSPVAETPVATPA